MAKRKLTDSERQARRDRESELLKDSVDRLRSSEGWKQWLDARSRFHSKSFRNQLLIAIQGQHMLEKGWVSEPPRLTAGFRGWLKLGYCVRKAPEDCPAGQWGMKIWAPCPPSKRQIQQARERGETEPRTAFRLTSTFGDCQVDPLPEGNPVPLRPPVRELEGDDLQDAWSYLVNLADDIGYPMSLKATPGMGGYMDPENKVIAVEADGCWNQRVKTAVHEIAHALVRAEPREDDGVKLTRRDEELLAEQTSYTVCRSLGLDTGEFSFAYLASWLQGREAEALEKVARLVDRLAKRIEDSLPDELFHSLPTAEPEEVAA